MRSASSLALAAPCSGNELRCSHSEAEQFIPKLHGWAGTEGGPVCPPCLEPSKFFSGTSSLHKSSCLMIPYVLLKGPPDSEGRGGHFHFAACLPFAPLKIREICKFRQMFFHFLQIPAIPTKFRENFDEKHDI